MPHKYKLSIACVKGEEKKIDHINLQVRIPIFLLVKDGFLILIWMHLRINLVQAVNAP